MIPGSGGRILTLPLKLLPPERDGVWERPAQPGDRSGTRINPKAILQGHALRLVARFPNTAALRGQGQDAPLPTAPANCALIALP